MAGQVPDRVERKVEVPRWFREHTTVRLTADGRHVVGMYYSAHRLALSHVVLRIINVQITVHVAVSAYQGMTSSTCVLVSLSGMSSTSRTVW